MVESELLEPLLRALRSSDGHAEIPVLVGNSKVAGVANIAGIMPKYRAMPCGHSEMIRLTHRRLITITSHGREKRLL
jgi:hypothetical protein